MSFVGGVTRAGLGEFARGEAHGAPVPAPAVGDELLASSRDGIDERYGGTASVWGSNGPGVPDSPGLRAHGWTTTPISGLY